MADKFTFDADMVRQLAELLNETDLNEIEYEVNDHRIRVVRHRQETVVAPHYSMPSPAPVSAPTLSVVSDVQDDSKNPGAVKSPMVGNAYEASDPSSPPFVKVGDSVSQGQTLLIIEAMKVMNPIKAPRAGKVTKILFSNAQPVEFDEVLLIIE
ncbi:MAG: acetyl-CoA carboxylase biotin carboxyl carrier protein [Alphaproteobacteria bacterium]|nr:acetyl-CoA carboxylase biotin carboxyl carrier protein [Alphaproteobacteria bacterium]